MKMYFSIRRKFSKDAFKLKIDYPIGEVRDTLALDRPERTPKGFLETFSYTKSRGSLFEDMLANDIGWNIFSPRLVKLLSECRNNYDLEFFPLPETACRFHPKLAEYRVLGVKREIACIDLDESDLHWENLPAGGKYIAAVYDCVLREKEISEEVDVFRVTEYPVMTVISSQLATEFAKLSPSGFVFRVIKAVAHQE
jgi:hypothetical protein